jgi:hypothetical protein
MPLIHRKSDKAFKHNVETEMKDHPESRAQNLAIAYAIKRRAQRKKMAQGGVATPDPKPKDDVPEPNKKDAEDFVRGINSADTNTKEWVKNFRQGLGMGMAEGGEVMSPSAAMMVDKRDLNQMDRMDNHQSEDCDMDMVGRIMKKREMHYSKGGMVANGGEDELNEMADSKPNNFDDLSLRDDLSSSYSGANSGDDLGNDQLSDDEADLVSRIMKSRRKKDHLPHPA